ncbi:EAL and HDOD domain-containing protein [Geomesophilobacter sediminis]|uniref:EAL domain-containing protein n=1 Tax=Geomesophilobacter sediminis TaxID=2798584 RepID=A0A8J7SAZ7_9BACT|nr:EAL domain-containing protein [Geomesophilobacter sediminis]MBJ6727780.1 EAL domain-containing protein [Geomesophilobacter sediminis]
MDDSSSYLIGRQPILNRSEEIVAYELLFRSPGATQALVQDAVQATANVIVNTLTGFGIEDILGGHKGFINLDFELLMNDSLQILPKEQMVLEILETVRVTPELVEQCRHLKEKGFVLALDDHVYNPDFHEIYQLADIVKLDLVQTPMLELAPMVEQFRRYPMKLLAEKVESQENYRSCLELGFELFQGYYFAKPAILEKKRLDDAGTTLLKLMRQLSEDAEIAEIERTIRESAGLTYKLLLLVNSVGIGSRMRIESLRHAITMIGRQQIKRWVQLALFAGNDARGIENPVVDMAAVRASLMESLAPRYLALQGLEDSPDKAFMTGILSMLDRIYDIPIDEMVEKLHLSDDVRDALVCRSGGFGRLLHLAELLEQEQFDHIRCHLDEMGITLNDVLNSQVKAFTWRAGM